MIKLQCTLSLVYFKELDKLLLEDSWNRKRLGKVKTPLKKNDQVRFLILIKTVRYWGRSDRKDREKSETDSNTETYFMMWSVMKTSEEMLKYSKHSVGTIIFFNRSVVDIRLLYQFQVYNKVIQRL